MRWGEGGYVCNSSLFTNSQNNIYSYISSDFLHFFNTFQFFYTDADGRPLRPPQHPLKIQVRRAYLINIVWGGGVIIYIIIELRSCFFVWGMNKFLGIKDLVVRVFVSFFSLVIVVYLLILLPFGHALGGYHNLRNCAKRHCFPRSMGRWAMFRVQLLFFSEI